ncbi:MAG TPA: hypothetical protein VGL12_06725 [Roseiarcus sp.]|jgi:hypothetical protein
MPEIAYSLNDEDIKALPKAPAHRQLMLCRGITNLALPETPQRKSTKRDALAPSCGPV